MITKIHMVHIDSDKLTCIEVYLFPSPSEGWPHLCLFNRNYDYVRLEYEGVVVGAAARSETNCKDGVTNVEFLIFSSSYLGHEGSHKLDLLRNLLCERQAQPVWKDMQTLSLTFPPKPISPCKAERAASLLQSVGVPARVSSEGVTIREKDLDEVIAFIELYRRKR